MVDPVAYRFPVTIIFVNFQDLLLSVLSGAINKQVMDFIIEHLSQQGLKQEAINVLMVKKLLGRDDEETPIVKPSNFK